MSHTTVAIGVLRRHTKGGYEMSALGAAWYIFKVVMWLGLMAFVSMFVIVIIGILCEGKQ